MSWSARRQLLYICMILLFLGAVSAYPIYAIFIRHTPTCSDGIQNQSEVGVDCGGVCPRACLDQVVPQPLIEWSRPFPVSGSIYNLVAYIQNPNVDYVGSPTRYLFKVFDKDNMLIGVAENTIALPPTHTFAVFEQGFNAGKRTVDHVTFEFVNDVVWFKYRGQPTDLNVSDEVLANASSTPRLDAVVKNKTTNVYKNIEVIALLYDADGNAVQASRTYIPILADNNGQNVTFTWPTAFDRGIATIEVIPKVPFDVK